MRKLALALLALLALALGLLQLGYHDVGPVVVTREDQQKVIFLLQQPREAVTQPGITLRWGLPLLEEVKTFDRRWLFLDSEPERIQTKERVPLEVDNYVVWKISNPRAFQEKLPGGLGTAEERIDSEVNARVREIVGTKTLDEVVTTEREEIMREITQQSRKNLTPLGIEIGDVRIVRTELPTGPLQNVYGRMRAERERLAREYRARGDERAREIRAEADKEARILVAQAHEKAERIRGEGDAQSAKIYADAYSADPEFYTFLRSLEAYRKLLGEGDTLVLPPDHELLEVLRRGGSKGAGGP